MPLDDYGIPPEILAALKRRVEKEITPRPATSDPSIDRAISKLDKAGYRQEINAADIQPMRMTDYLAGSDTLGSTDPENNVRLNPVSQAIYPDFKNTQTLAHELTHVRQHMRPGGLAQMAIEHTRPYEQRPTEEEAYTAGNNYVKGLPEKDVNDQMDRYQKDPNTRNNYYFGYPYAFPKFIPADEYKDKDPYAYGKR